ncbi:MAG TPA: 50S ribosomal protein L4 [Gemmatimonadaceae bacterium]|jgi:large subunit ribosomal protein L4|nr:50S ribosomal protein L4 [Gemmatimonadaceae bacterium]
MADSNTTQQAPAFTALGTARPEKVALPETTFDGVINMPVMHQAVKAFMANQRQGNAATKIRKYVVGGNQKPWKQKGTGRARQGSTRAPHFVGGGTVFGPTPRPYDEYVPRQVRALAKKSALNARARENAIVVIDGFNYDAPHTASLIALTARLGVSDKKVLVLTDGVKPNVFLSGRNIPNVHVMPYSDSSTYHILWSDVVLVEAGAIGQTLEPVKETEAPLPKRERPAAEVAKGERKVAKRAAKAAAKQAAPKKVAKKAAKQAAKKAAPKKTTAKKSTAKKSAATKSTKKKEK